MNTFIELPSKQDHRSMACRSSPALTPTLRISRTPRRSCIASYAARSRRRSSDQDLRTGWSSRSIMVSGKATRCSIQVVDDPGETGVQEPDTRLELAVELP